MKRMILFPLILLLSLCMMITASAGAASEAEQETTEETAADVLVIYFSATGTTRGVAEKIAALEEADLYEIVPAQAYTDEDLEYSNPESRATMEQNDPACRPEIAGELPDLSQYETIYLGYPIWWGQEPRIMDRFVESADLGSKTIIPFCTSGSSGIGDSGANLEANAGSGTWKQGQRFPGDVSEEDLQAWIEETKGADNMVMRIGDTKVSVTWEENASVEELRALAASGLTISMSMYGGFEQVGSIGQAITRNDEQTVTGPGDIVLYSGDQLVVFYGSNSWAYTRLGRINLSEAELTELLSNGDVTITLQAE